MSRQTTSRTAVDEQISALDHMLGELVVAVDAYRDDPVDWDDLDALIRLQHQIAGDARALGAARALAELRRAARKVSVTVHQLAATKT